MDCLRSPLPMEAQVEPPGDVPRAISGSSFYRVGSDSTLEELQKQMDKQAMATGSMPAAERLDRIAPDPCEGSCPLPMPKAGTGAESIPLEVPPSHDKCCLSCIDRLCVIFILPVGVVLHGRPWWVTTVRSAAVLVCIMQWAVCLYTAVTGGNTGWQTGSCLPHVSEATANLILLLQQTCSISFQEFNAYVKEAMQCQTMGPAPKAAIKQHILVRLVAMGGGHMTWQVDALPCLQCLYRAAWVLWLLRLKEFVDELVDAFCRSCASSPEDVDLAYIRWARVSAFTGQITQHSNAVYGVMGVTALMGGVAPIVEVFMSSSLSSQSTDWMLPQLIGSIMAFWLMTYVFGSVAMVSEKCKKAACLVNCLQGCLPEQSRAEIRRLVGYMESSDSGIFFGGTKLDLSLYSKLRYVTFSASVVLAVRFQTLPEAHKSQLAEQWSRFLRAWRCGSEPVGIAIRTGLVPGRQPL
eukprot:s4893_g4.t1